MTRGGRTRTRRIGGTAAAGLVGLWLALGCRSDGAPALHTAIDAPEPGEPGADGTKAPPKGGPSDGRELWFVEGPGREAIIARERRDHETARERLDALLAAEPTSADERGAAELLRALEHLEQDEHAAAAERFAKAREAPGLRPIEDWLRRWEAQARLDAGQPEVARTLVDELEAGLRSRSAVAGDLQVIEGDARQRTDDLDGARAAYDAYLSDHPQGDRRFEVQAKLARMLAAREDEGSRREALTLYDRLRESVPLSDYADEAEAAIPGLEKAVGALRSESATRVHERELGVLRVEAMLDRGRYAVAIKEVDRLVGKGKLDAAQRCRLLYVKGSAIFKQRRRADARPSFERAERECAKAGKAFETTQVKSRYQGARGWYAEGKYAKAGAVFESIAAEHGDHSYADDALVLAGESWESHGDPERAARAYHRAIEEHPGDMRHEALRRLLVMRFVAGAYAEVLALVDDALKGSIVHPAERAKLLYFRGRALDRLGRSDEADEAWLEAVATAPLDYPALQALSRLRERGPQPWAQALDRLRGGASVKSRDEASAAQALQRARILARLGLGDEARDELRHAKIDGWPAIAVLNQAGLYPAAQRELANLGARWRAQAPGADNRERWEGAHPRPFAEIIDPGEPEHEVPALLTYAIMQTESRFDPGVTSFAGARGLVQLMPATAKGLAKAAGIRLDGDRALFDPALNLDLGMRYLGRLTARFGGGEAAVALAIPSYNAGAGSVDRWLRERGSWDLDLFIESIPYDETRKYTQSVLGRWWAYRWLYAEGEPEQRVPYLPLTVPSKGADDSDE
ncbi:MAG: transglycosylase SLT domain-containing protein [Myxococcales bacterium]|nr:transglycosylase SLT domain-containing protein [Myxococcales bacterium]